MGKTGLAASAAGNVLLEVGLDAEEGVGRKKVEVPARGVDVAERALKAKGLGVTRAAEMPDAPEREVDVSKLDVPFGRPAPAYGALAKGLFRGKKK